MTHRALLLSLLADYQPKTEDELQDLHQTRIFVQEEESCFERSLEKGHITASAWLVNRENTHALLMLHAKLNLWCQLGGHCDGNGDVLFVAVKEAQEESGISHIIPVSNQIFDISIHPIPFYKGIPAHLHYDIRFLLQVQSEEVVKQNEESQALLWVSKSPSELPSQESSLLRLHRKWISYYLTSRENCT